LPPEARWIPQARLLRDHVPPAIRHWLFDRASLTRRLRAACHGRFRVQLLSQRRQGPLLGEARRLGLAPHASALVREVRLLCDEGPWVFARTVIPLQTLRGRTRRLAHLGTRPLGAMLFADASMERDEVEIARLDPGSALFEHAARGVAIDEPIWARRSVFRVAGKPLLVSEIFLPSLLGSRPEGYP
jgi:chorismate--pyruvate lyase